MRGMEGAPRDSVTSSASWLRCYRCWSQNLEVQVHYEGILKVDPETAEAIDKAAEAGAVKAPEEHPPTQVVQVPEGGQVDPSGH